IAFLCLKALLDLGAQCGVNTHNFLWGSLL
ncbi:MAG: hypothetical protein RLZZ252_1217, partial [Bacteroidota bacterium]